VKSYEVLIGILRQGKEEFSQRSGDNNALLRLIQVSEKARNAVVLFASGPVAREGLAATLLPLMVARTAEASRKARTSRARRWRTVPS